MQSPRSGTLGPLPAHPHGRPQGHLLLASTPASALGAVLFTGQSCPLPGPVHPWGGCEGHAASQHPQMGVSSPQTQEVGGGFPACPPEDACSSPGLFLPWPRAPGTLGLPPRRGLRGRQGGGVGRAVKKAGVSDQAAQSQGAGETGANTTWRDRAGALGSERRVPGALGLGREPFPTPTSLGRARHWEVGPRPPAHQGSRTGGQTPRWGPGWK